MQLDARNIERKKQECFVMKGSFNIITSMLKICVNLIIEGRIFSNLIYLQTLCSKMHYLICNVIYERKKKY